MTDSTTTCTYSNPLVIGHGVLRNATSGDDKVPFEFGSSTCATLYGINTSTDPSYYNGFTYGEIVISVLVLLITVAVFYSFFWFSVRGVKIKQ